MKQITNNPEESTQHFGLTDSRMHRRRADSPWLWARLVAGSLVLHGVLLAIALPLTARLSAASQSESLTPVEFVELAEASPEPAVKPPIEAVASSTASPEPVSPPESAPVQPALNETAPPNDISFAPEPSPKISPLPIPSPEVLPSSESSPEPSPEISPSPEVPAETPLETAALPPQPDSLPLPVLPSPLPEPSTAPEPSRPETSAPEAPLQQDSDRPPSDFPSPDPLAASPAPNLPSPQPETSPSNPGLQTTSIDTPVPDVSQSIAAAPSTVDSNNLNSANSEAAVVGVTLSLSSSSRVAPRGDEPVETLEVARPTNKSTRFLPDPSASACQVTPEVLNRAGTPVALQVTTDEQGKVMDVSVYQSSNSAEYDQLAVCLVKEQWYFEPATVLNAGETQRQAIASDELLITLTIDRN